VNDLLRARRDAMAAALEKHFPDAKWTRPEGGFFIWLELPGGVDARKVLKGAEGVTAVDGTEFSAPAYMVRLAYSFVSPEEIETGIERLATAYALTVSEG
jgi:2-aminoadipate transaminase